MFDWLGDLLGNAFGSLGQQISSAIFDVMMKWIYEQIYNAVADFFTQMGNMGAEIFDLGVVQSTISLFTLFGWALFAAGTVVAVFDVAVEYQNGRASIKTTAINILKGFFACSLIGIVPVELYKFCISLQNSLAKDLSLLHSSGKSLGLAEESTELWKGAFALTNNVSFSLDDCVCLLCCHDILRQYQARRYPAYPDGGRLAVYVQSAERLSGRLQSVDETGDRNLSDGIYADNSAVFGLDDIP